MGVANPVISKLLSLISHVTKLNEKGVDCRKIMQLALDSCGSMLLFKYDEVNARKEVVDFIIRAKINLLNK